MSFYCKSLQNVSSYNPAWLLAASLEVVNIPLDILNYNQFNFYRYSLKSTCCFLLIAATSIDWKKYFKIASRLGVHYNIIIIITDDLLKHYPDQELLSKCKLLHSSNFSRLKFEGDSVVSWQSSDSLPLWG